MSEIYHGNSFELFGFRIPYLPDFLADHTLLGDTAEQRLAETCRRWEYFVGSLWGLSEGAVYQLRYTYNPPTGATDVLFLGRVVAGVNAGAVAEGVARGLEAIRVPATPVPLEGLLAGLSPRAAHLFEVRQAEQELVVTHAGGLLDVSGKEYLVLPWWGPGGAFLGPAAALAAGSAPVTLAVVLAPTTLSESADLAVLASRMATAAGTPMEAAAGSSGRGRDVHHMDPQAEWLGRIHAANLRRLHRPFLVTAYAFSNAPVAARGVAAALAAAIGDERPFEPPVGEATVLPSRADLLELQAERADVLRAVGELEFYQSSVTLAPADRPGLDRLRYLCDARGAAAAFRLPVNVRGGIPGLPVRQRSPDCHPGPRVRDRPNGHIVLGTYEDGGLATLPVGDFTKHALVTGFTGSGKTVTVLNLLHQLWLEGVPFLVLESAKQEYRGYFGVPAVGSDLRVYTLGNETAVPLRLNPFELLPGVRVEAHVSRLQVCLEAAVPPIGPSSSVIAEALLRVYAACGWELTDTAPDPGPARRRFPQLSEFVAAVEKVIVDRKYVGEILANLTAALVGRFRPLLLGSKKRMFDCPVSFPPAEELFALPTVLELNDLNVDDKALVVMFVLTFLREHREREYRRRPPDSPPLVHVTLVEEAHNVLENVGSKGTGDGATAADTRFKAVEAFCQLLTEIRALGEGLIVADQSPEKLAPDAMRNTNLQIAHQLRDGNDRAAVANAMIMTDEQRDYLGKLPPGQAAVFRTGLEQATFVRVPKYYPSDAEVRGCPTDAQAAAEYREQFPGWGFAPNMIDADVVKRMEQRDAGLTARRQLPLAMPGCERCQNKCRHRDAIFSAFEAGGAGREDVAEWTARLAADDSTAEELWRLCAVAAARGAAAAGTTSPNGDAPWCYFVHMWHRRFGATDQASQVGGYYEKFHNYLAATRGRF